MYTYRYILVLTVFLFYHQYNCFSWDGISEFDYEIDTELNYNPVISKLSSMDQDDLTRHKRQTTNITKPKNCSMELFQEIRKCCKPPHIIKAPGVRKYCFQNVSDGNATLTIRDRICGHSCLLQNQSLITSSGNLDIEKLTALFNNGSDSNWKPIILNAIKNCTASIKAVNVTLSSGAPCYPLPAAIFMCIHRSMIINGTALLNNGVTCTCSSANVQALKLCDPMRFIKRITKN